MFAPLLALALAAPARLAVLPVAAGEGVTDKTAAALTEALAAEVRKRSGAEIITKREIDTVLSLERQKAMMGCSTDACMAELGGALGVSNLVNGDVAKVGESLLVHFRLVDVSKVRVVAQADRRLRKGTLDDILDQIPAMVGELFPGASAAQPPGGERPAGTSQSAQPSSGQASAGGQATREGSLPGPKPASAKPPQPWADEPAKLTQEQVATLSLWGDGNGNYVALNGEEMTDVVLAGTARKLYTLRYASGVFDGEKRSGSKSFWDPRVGRRGEFRYGPDEGTLTCAADFSFKRIHAAEARKILSQAELLLPRWRRVPYLLARDDQGTYFYVDGRRTASGDEADPPDFRLYVGKKGSMALIDLQDAIKDSAGLIFVTSAGRLVARRQGQKYAVEWVAEGTRLGLTWLDLSEQGPLIYRDLGVYAGQSLGTPCDGRL